jgi:hypothetical protein
MNNEELLIHTLDDLSLRINSNDEYEVLLASTLIRKIFLDDHPLIDQVNKKYKIKFEFEFVEITPPIISGFPITDFWSVIESLDPSLAPTNAEIIRTNRDKFFASIIGIADKHQYTIKDIIKFVANVMGGVHLGAPKNNVEEALNKLRDFSYFSELSIPLQQIRSISRIIIKALRPIKYKILNLERFENHKGLSIHFLLTFFPTKENTNNFIFDIGIEDNKNRLSAFINHNHELYFQLYDSNSCILKVSAGKAESSYIYGSPIYISCELASYEQEIMLSIDTGTWNYCKIFNMPTQLSFLENLHYVVGSNFNGRELTNMSIIEQVIYSRTLNFNEKVGLYNYFQNQIRNGYQQAVRLEGNQFFHSKKHPNFLSNETE